MRRQARGFTLTEIMVAVAIFAIIFVATLMIYDRSNIIFRDSMEASDLQQNTRVAFETLVSEIRMAGFDFDRDGLPTGSVALQQPDEQLEYIGEHAITFRANLDYETDPGSDNGVELEYQPGWNTTAEDDDFFPVVTTGNDEIVTYALVSDDPSANTDSITFYADVAKPRAAYPGGSSESLVTISGVDLCNDGKGCENPPYTLYRYTLKEDGTPEAGVPVATNIRTLNFTYFSDALAANVITPNAGEGQYTVSGTGVTTSATAEEARNLRETVQSIHVELIGMTEFADKNWNDPIEAAQTDSVASAAQHRQYQLQSNVIPRNLGRRGLQEPTTTPPGAPFITNVCSIGCGVVRVDWKAPEYGIVDSYSILYDTNPAGPFGSSPVSAGSNLFGFVGGLDPNTSYYFIVVAKNSYGSERSDPSLSSVQPINYTKPDVPIITAVTGDGTVPPTDDNITVTLQLPAFNVDFNGNPPVNACGDSAVDIESAQELEYYEVYRSTDPAFDPALGQGDLIYDGVVPSDGQVLDDDPKVSCTTYYYRARIREECASDPALNSANDTAQAYSDYSAVSSASVSTASVEPAIPGNVMTVDAGSSCTGGVCDVTLQWDRVTTDVNGKAILVGEYEIVRYLYVAATGTETSQTVIPVTDTNPSAGGQYSYVDAGLPEPATGDYYTYYVAAVRQSDCVGGVLKSGYSSPEAKFPCVSATVTLLETTIEGDGLSGASPYLVDMSGGSSLADFEVVASKQVATVSMVVTDPGGGNVAGGSATLQPDGVTAYFSAPMTTGTWYKVDMILTDTLGCATTITRYVEGSVSSCCLIPFKDAFGTVFDATIITSTSQTGDTVYIVTLKNQCGTDVTLQRFNIAWSVANLSTFKTVTYADGTVTSFNSAAGALTITPATTVVVPSNGSTTMDLRFETNNRPVTDLTSFCAEYTDGVSTDSCTVVQTAGVCTIP
ncbi:MAG: prepilin-type N-terminal cleavage/methylation domain-containing protein [Acidobacteria bacterium]|nr:prepilin-type N-terminal cleavage/methylation domain-containing protein [Acidobacteriota bacterium]